MHRILVITFLLSIAGFACQQDSPDLQEFTGREVSYSLFSGADIGSAGMVTFRERVDSSVDIIVSLDQKYSGSYPVHLHYGDLSVENAPQATLLANLEGTNGKSETNISLLADESVFTFERAESFDGSVKVHLANGGPDYSVILAAGNIGSNVSKGFNLQGIATCGDSFEF